MSEPNGETDAGRGAEGKRDKVDNLLERKLGKHYPLIIITLTVVGVAIAWLTWRNRSNSSISGLDPNAGASYTSGTGIGQPTGGGTVAGGGAPAGLAALIRNQTHMLQQIESTLRGQSRPGHHVPGFDFSSMNHSWANEPVTAPARFLYGKAAQGLHYIKDRATGVIYQINPNGKRYALTPAQYAELGRPKFTLFGRPRNHRDQHNPHPGTPRRRRVGWRGADHPPGMIVRREINGPRRRRGTPIPTQPNR